MKKIYNGFEKWTKSKSILENVFLKLTVSNNIIFFIVILLILKLFWFIINTFN